MSLTSTAHPVLSAGTTSFQRYGVTWHMSVIAELSVPTDQFALGETLPAVPDASVEFERVVTHSQEWVMPFLWVTGDGREAFDERVRDDATVADADLVHEFDHAWLYQMEWDDDVTRLVNAIFDRKGTLLDAVGDQECWDVEVRFRDHDALSRLQEHFDRTDVAFTVDRVYAPTEPRRPGYTLTPTQRRSLVAALERGYFDVPRRTSMTTLADELDISTNALSERLRRATANVVRTAVTTPGPGGPDATDSRRSNE